MDKGYFDDIYKKQDSKFKNLLIKLKQFQIKTNGNDLNKVIADDQIKIKNKFFSNCKYILNEINDVNQDTQHWKMIFNSWLNFFIVSYLYKLYFFKSLDHYEAQFLKGFENKKIDISIFEDFNDFMYEANDLGWNYEFLQVFSLLEKKTINKDFNLSDFIKIKKKIIHNKSSKLYLIKSKIKFVIDFFLKKILKKNFIFFAFPDRLNRFNRLKIYFKNFRKIYF